MTFDQGHRAIKRGQIAALEKAIPSDIEIITCFILDVTGAARVSSGVRPNPMTKVTPEEIVEFVRGHGNLELSTLAQKHGFTVRAIGDRLEYVPCSCETPRP